MTTRHTEQQKSDVKSHFLDLLIELDRHFTGRRAELAALLGVARETVSRVREGAKPSETLALLIEKVHKEIFLNKDSFPPHLQPLLTEWTQKTGLTESQFVNQALIRYGQQTCDAIIASRVSLDRGHEGAALALNEAAAQIQSGREAGDASAVTYRPSKPARRKKSR